MIDILTQLMIMLNITVLSNTRSESAKPDNSDARFPSSASVNVASSRQQHIIIYASCLISMLETNQLIHSSATSKKQDIYFSDYENRDSPRSKTHYRTSDKSQDCFIAIFRVTIQLGNHSWRRNT